MINIYKEAPQYSLRLVENEAEEGVDLVIVNSHGNVVSAGYILGINEAGITRYGAINKSIAKRLGLPLDSLGCLVINPEDTISAEQATGAENAKEEEW